MIHWPKLLSYGLSSMAYNFFAYFYSFLESSIIQTMEEVLSRFPHLGEKIFEELDNQVLTNCRTICKSWKDFIDENKIVVFRIVKNYTECSDSSLMKLCSKVNVETVANIHSLRLLLFTIPKEEPDKAGYPLQPPPSVHPTGCY